jgi:glutamate racemase
MQKSHPIGVFDSGVGGLSVLRDIRRELWNEDLIYVADSSHAPYGDKSAEYIEARAISIVEFLLQQSAKAIVVACNTATSAAVAALRARFRVPIIAMEPAVKPAVAQTQSGVIGVLATRRTVASENFLNLLQRFGNATEIVVQPCPGLAEQVEAGDLAGLKTRSLLQQYIQPLLEKGADTIVLGCTHYPFLENTIQTMIGPNIAIIDPGEAIARELRRRLTHAGGLSTNPNQGAERFWTSACPENAQAVISQLWQMEVEVKSLPTEYCGA